MEAFDVKLEALMLNKAFEKLDPKERAYVLEHLTEVAYTNYHFVLKNTVKAFACDEIDLVPNPNITEVLREHFDAKFLPANTPLFFNIFQPLTLYRSVAALAMVAIISFFMVNKISEKINTQKPEHIIVRATPIGIKEKLDKVERIFPASGNAKIKKYVSVAKIKMEKDSVVNKTTELLGLEVFEPLLCLDIDINEPMPCLNDEALTN
jgi:hypothetical protein